VRREHVGYLIHTLILEELPEHPKKSIARDTKLFARLLVYQDEVVSLLAMLDSADTVF